MKEAQRHRRADLTGVRLYPISQRRNKVSLEDFIHPGDPRVPPENPELDRLAERIRAAHSGGHPTIVMLGAHVIKCGLSLLIIDLMERGVITHVALNGAGAIHDFEIALIGGTSEQVEETLPDGRFGMAEETGQINEIVKRSDRGFGESVGEFIDSNLQHSRYSILASGHRLGIPVTVHVAIGTDIIHQHPNFDAAATGRATYEDFRTFISSVSRLEDGVVLNIGSAVILPEVFLKALSVARNLGHRVDAFTAANLDMIDHYRPRVNVVERPTGSGGEGFNIIELHQKSIPYLHWRIVGK